MTPIGRYDCSLLRKHNWFKMTPFGFTLLHRYFFKDTFHHLKMWIIRRHYDWWNYYPKYKINEELLCTECRNNGLDKCTGHDSANFN